MYEKNPKSVNYVDNKKFSEAVAEYNKKKIDAIEKGLPIPRVPEYIGACFIKIANGVARLGNFSQYTWKEDMIADGIEDCLRRISNFRIDTDTRTSYPNAFFYFSKIAYYAFVRRLKKEKDQGKIKQKFIEQSVDIDFFLSSGDEGGHSGNEIGSQVSQQYFEDAYNRRENYKK